MKKVLTLMFCFVFTVIAGCNDEPSLNEVAFNSLNNDDKDSILETLDDGKSGVIDRDNNHSYFFIETYADSAFDMQIDESIFQIIINEPDTGEDLKIRVFDYNPGPETDTLDIILNGESTPLDMRY
ncbi:hypothetical protein [Corticicoccus populi]|uniref:Uncharacterized protein n=1 Tax=Corticicoccus populi TaxID=1812821 RepID=A0ABW5WV78_9STAP